MDDFNVAPEREMPTAVRDRIHARVFDQIDAGERQNYKRWIPVAAAILVAILVSGISALSGTFEAHMPTMQGASGGSSSPVVPRFTAPDDSAIVEQCWDAVRTSPTASRFPPKSAWTSVLKAVGRSSVVVGYKADGRVIFCELTPSGTTVSDPTVAPIYLPGTHTAALLVTQFGTIAGVADPAALGLTISVTSPGRDIYSGPATEGGGLFIFLSVVATERASITVGGTKPGSMSSASGLSPLPPPAAPAVVPTAAAEAADRSSERGRLLESCLQVARGFLPAVGTQSWRPGATVAVGDERVIMAVGDDAQVSACVQQEHRAQVLAGIGIVRDRGDRLGAPELAGVMPSLRGRPLLAGSLPADVSRVELDLPDGTVAVADVADSTFVVLLPASMLAQEQGPMVLGLDRIRWRTYNVAGELLFNDFL